MGKTICRTVISIAIKEERKKNLFVCEIELGTK